MERIERGSVPEIGKLLGATVGEFIDNIGPYALAGVAQLVVTIPLVFLSLFVIYGGIFGVLIGGGVATAGVASAVDEDAAPIVAVVGELGTFGLLAIFMFGAIALLTALFAPLQASLVRAVAAQQRGDEKLEFTSMFKTISQDVVPVILVNVVVAGLASVGFMFCYLPGFIVLFACAFATALVALHRRGAVEAVRLSATTSFANPGFHVAYFLIMMAISLAAANIPVLGAMFIVAMQVRAARELYGDGEEPQPPVPAL